MTPAFTPGEPIARFRSAIAARLGLQFDDGRVGFLGEVLWRRVRATGKDVDVYLSHLDLARGRDELGALAQELTVPETYFFRNIEQYRAFGEVAIPGCIAARGGERRLRIASLGCASGEEAYSLAILTRDALPDPAWDISIVGADINAAMLEKARRGRFTAWALRETPDDDKRRWFRVDGRDFVLHDALRESVRFELHNLVDDGPTIWPGSTYDVVFCRNVVMYFVPDQARRLIERIARALRPGGYLFLGHAETLRGLSQDFHLRHTHGTFYYQRLTPEEDVAASASAGHRAAHAWPDASLAAAADAPTWVEAIQRASDRVAALTAPRAREMDARNGNAASGTDARAASSAHIGADNDATTARAPWRRAAAPADVESRDANGSGSRSASSAWDRGVVFELLRTERFADALAIVDALPPESARDSDVLLLRSVLLTHGGELARAEDACRRLLDVDELSAGAHYLLALCREGVGDRVAASYHDQVAAYLDPAFAMPRLHLGLLARRAGERNAACRELGEALRLLQREDASRVLLFGGGFGRDALVALCRSELSRCGGTP